MGFWGRDMSVNAAKYGILVGVDGSAESDAAIRWAADEAVMRGLGDLVDATKDAWMVVVGNSDLGAVGRAVLGSVSGGLVHHAHCPVTVVHETDTDLSERTSPV